MDKQKAQFLKFLGFLGFEDTAAQAMVSSFLTPEDGKEPTLDIDGILAQSQVYAKEYLAPTFKKELASHFKGQYMGEAINKFVAASKGKLKRTDYQNESLEKVIEDFTAAIERDASSTDGEKDTLINELRQQLSDAQNEKETSLQALRDEFSEKENARLTYDGMLSLLGSIQNPGEGKVGKKLSVDQAHAAKAILRELSDEFVIKYDEAKKTLVPYDKANPGQVASDGTKFLSISDLVDKSLQRNNWIAQSNGGQAGRTVNIPTTTFNKPDAGAYGQQRQVSSFRQALEAQTGTD